MHVIFVSECEGPALLRTRRILDRYSQRIGQRSWRTPITNEVLTEVHRHLRRIASRKTAVACYRNFGTRHSRLLWIVGNKSTFGLDGSSAVASRAKPVPLEPWLRQLCLLAGYSGLAHDIGKASLHFQDKLRSGKNPKDRHRHEWVSMMLLQALRANGYDWVGAWNFAAPTISVSKRKRPGRTAEGVEKHLRHLTDLVDFAVLTHHGLLGSNNELSYNPTIQGSHVNRPNSDDYGILRPDSRPMAEDILKRLKSYQVRLGADAEAVQSLSFLRGATVVVRSALILADHEVSSRTYDSLNDDRLAANTRRAGSNNKRQLNQPLDWHLGEVSNLAAAYVRNFYHHNLPYLSVETQRHILRPSPLGTRFVWQDKAAVALLNRSVPDNPTLVLNVAGTGEGKTIANLKCLAALRPDGELRVAAGFNLRTLTLQTYDDLTRNLGVPDIEAACVIGDRFVRYLHEKELENTDQDDLDLDEGNVEYDSTPYRDALPEWLLKRMEDKPSLGALIGAPLLVSTIDYLIHAGDPSKQGHHGNALLRIASSDLILDELDSYDSKAIVSVLRVIQMSAFFGRNIVISSATLPEPIVSAVLKAYSGGISMRSAVQGVSSHYNFACISSLSKPLVRDVYAENPDEPLQHFLGSVTKQLHALASKPTFRMCFVQDVQIPAKPASDEAISNVAESVLSAIEILHKNQAWEARGKRVSFGVVRLAHVKDCIALAPHLGKQSNIHLCVYHSVDVNIRRAHKEKTLGKLLSRKGVNPNRSILSDPDIEKRILETAGEDVIFVVLVSPIEEVGRDHDFDWGVIEPSSVHSIVQMAGRINRHRLIAVSLPNIAILRFNLTNLKKSDIKARSFYGPGQEFGFIYRTHDLNELLLDNNGQFEQIIDARLRFGFNCSKCQFAQLDDQAIELALAEPLKCIAVEEGYPMGWACKSFYKDFSLRDHSANLEYRLGHDSLVRVVEWSATGRTDLDKVPIREDEGDYINGPWLSLTVKEMMDKADQLPDGHRHQALCLQRSAYVQNGSLVGLKDFYHHGGGH